MMLFGAWEDLYGIGKEEKETVENAAVVFPWNHFGDPYNLKYLRYVYYNAKDIDLIKIWGRKNVYDTPVLLFDSSVDDNELEEGRITFRNSKQIGFREFAMMMQASEGGEMIPPIFDFESRGRK